MLSSSPPLLLSFSSRPLLPLLLFPSSLPPSHLPPFLLLSSSKATEHLFSPPPRFRQPMATQGVRRLHHHRRTQPPPATKKSVGDRHEPCSMGTMEQAPSSPVSTLTTQLQPQSLEQGSSGGGGGGDGLGGGGGDGGTCGDGGNPGYSGIGSGGDGGISKAEERYASSSYLKPAVRRALLRGTWHDAFLHAMTLLEGSAPVRAQLPPSLTTPDYRCTAPDCCSEGQRPELCSRCSNTTPPPKRDPNDMPGKFIPSFDSAAVMRRIAGLPALTPPPAGSPAPRPLIL